jgi:CBS domain-containing protein
VLPLIAAQCVGAAVGNVLCPHNIVAEAATVGLVGGEGAVLRRTLIPGLLYALSGGAAPGRSRDRRLLTQIKEPRSMAAYACSLIEPGAARAPCPRSSDHRHTASSEALMSKVRDIMRHPVEVIAPETSVLVASLIMRERGLGFIPVCQSQRVLGLVTDRDIVVRCVAARLRPDTTCVQEVMSVKPICCNEDEDVEATRLRMKDNAVRRLVVCDREGGCAGVVSRTDISGSAAPAQPKDYEVAFQREVSGGRRATLARVRVTRRADREDAVAVACQEFERERGLTSWSQLADSFEVSEF